MCSRARSSDRLKRPLAHTSLRLSAATKAFDATSDDLALQFAHGEVDAEQYLSQQQLMLSHVTDCYQVEEVVGKVI